MPNTPITQVFQFACLKDNYGFLLRDTHTGIVISIDSPDADAITHHIMALGWNRLDFVLNTHKHNDHCGGNRALTNRFNCEVIAPAEVTPHAPVDRVIRPGETLKFGNTHLDVLDLGGHTLGLVGYYQSAMKHVFLGDLIFPLGCGRMFEGTPEQFWQSLETLMALGEDTHIYSAHEYAASNLRFALSLEPIDSVHHQNLMARKTLIEDQRAVGRATVPSLIKDEIKTNPFLIYPLRFSNPDERIAEFKRLRALKDHF
jgi:hydroxyacylglutathione hydrolase